MEVWIFLRRFPGYEVSNMGRVRRRNKSWPRDRRVKQYHYLKAGKTETGYMRLTIRLDKHGQGMLVHRLVLEAFVGPCPEDLECNHKNQERDDNVLTNLEWITRTENLKHRQMTDKWRNSLQKAREAKRLKRLNSKKNAVDKNSSIDSRPFI